MSRVASVLRAEFGIGVGHGVRLLGQPVSRLKFVVQDSRYLNGLCLNGVNIKIITINPEPFWLKSLLNVISTAA